MAEDFQGGYTKVGKLWKLPMSAAPSTKKWQARYICARDGFLMYYKTSKAPEFFNPKAAGVIPLGGAKIELVAAGPEKLGITYGLKITHPDFAPGCRLMLAAETEDEQRSWFDVLTECSRVTLENALLGDKMLEQLRSQGAEAAEGQRRALAALQEHSEKLASERAKREKLATDSEAMIAEREAELAAAIAASEAASAAAAANEAAAKESAEAAARLRVERQRLESEKAEKEAEAARAAEEAVRLEAERERLESEKAATEAEATRAAEQAARLQSERARLESEKAAKEVEAARAAEEAARLQAEVEAKAGLEEKLLSSEGKSKELADKLATAEKERKALQKRLRAAEDSLARLDAALKRSGVTLDIEIAADVKSLRSFFESRAEEVARDAKRLDIMRAAVTAKRDYTRRASDSLTPGEAAKVAAEVVKPDGASAAAAPSALQPTSDGSDSD